MRQQFFSAGMDFLSAIFVSVIIGYGLDWFFDTKPWGMIAMIVLGFVSGVYQLMRKTKL